MSKQFRVGLLGLTLVFFCGISNFSETAALAAKKTRPSKRIGIGDVKRKEITPELRKAVKDGLDFLALGALNSAGGAASKRYSLAVTSLTGLAFLANGETPSRGPHAVALKRCLAYVLRQANPTTGLLSEPESRGLMYSHGFATLFLAEAYGMTRDTRLRSDLRRAVRKAVRLIESSQGPGGGWSYAPKRQAERYDMSIGVCQTMALRAARNAGIAVSEQVVKKAIQCAVNARTTRATGPDARMAFNYISNGTISGSGTWPVTNGTLCVLFGLGVDQDNGKKDPKENPALMIEPALRWIKDRAWTRDRNGTPILRGRNLPGGTHRFYANYYAVQAMAHAGREEYWGEWFPLMREQLLRMKGSNDRWGGEISSQYCTAMACLMLSVPFQLLPTFEH